MKRFEKKLLSIATATSFVLTSLTGCSGNLLGKDTSSTNTLKATAIVVGPHSCSRELNLSNEIITTTVSDNILNYGYISIIVVDGKPSIISAESYDIPDQYKKATRTKLESDAERKAKNLLLNLSTVKADDPEVDTLEAIRLATRSLSTVPEGTEKSMIIVDTGWSTTGLMNFSNNLLSGEPNAVAEMLSEKDAVPNLSGYTVYWLQMGDVAAPEEELSPSQVKKLSAIWQAVIEKGGGTFILSESAPNNGILGDSLPEVSTVSHDAETPVMFDEADCENSEISFENPMFFSEEQIQFKGDSDQYVDENKALESIKPIAAYMEKNEDFSIMLVGTTAGDENSYYAKELSARRAEAVKKTLVLLGIAENRIITKGLGSEDKWHIYGAGTSGNLAAQNRKVVLLDASSNDAKEIIDRF